ncbi:MAG: spermidine/putrescine transport system ATP-binding protein [Elusimicrobia bacterium]|nr:MAG: spermidine/putrescine transport system ATP-binding protein [Elusimicrobiota bacterium]
MPDPSHSVELKGVVKRFGAVTAVDGVDLTIRKGEFFALLGSSGCGKTTLLRMIAGFEFPDSGGVLIQGRDVARVPANERPVNMVFQHYALFPHMTVKDNVAFGLRMKKLPEGEVAERASEVLRTVQLGALAGRYPHQLSGGQQQRVALARALVNRPEVLLLDEPLAALDEKLRQEMRHELKALQVKVGITFVFVTHDQEEALALADRIAVMRGGRIQQLGTPQEVYETPASRFVADFVGVSNLLEGTVTDAEPLLMEGKGESRRASLDVSGVGGVSATLFNGVKTGDKVTLCLRPERIHLASDGAAAELDNRLPGLVESTIFLGGEVRYRVRLAGGRELEVHETSSPLRHVRRPGERVLVQWRAEDARAVAE